jgi:excisionase family DNA binding protein
MTESTPLVVAQAAEQTGIPKRTILHAITTGVLPAQKLPGIRGQYLIKQADLDQYAARRRSEATTKR